MRNFANRSVSSLPVRRALIETFKSGFNRFVRVDGHFCESSLARPSLFRNVAPCGATSTL